MDTRNIERASLRPFGRRDVEAIVEVRGRRDRAQGRYLEPFEGAVNCVGVTAKIPGSVVTPSLKSTTDSY